MVRVRRSVYTDQATFGITIKNIDTDKLNIRVGDHQLYPTDFIVQSPKIADSYNWQRLSLSAAHTDSVHVATAATS